MISQEIKDKIREFIKASPNKWISVREVCDLFQKSQMKGHILLLDLETQGFLKRKESSKTGKYTYRWWYLPEDEEVVPKIDADGGAKDERVFE